LGACGGVNTFTHYAASKFLEDNMKSIALAAALSLAATSAFAGSYVAEPMMEPAVMVEKASSSSGGGVLVPLIVLLVLVAASRK